MNVDVDAAVVGAGHNGLVTAWYLAKAGLRVHVFERRPFVGGAAVTQELWPGFFFSTCAHAVHGLHPEIVRDMRLYDRGLEVIRRGAGVALLPDGRYWGPADLDAPRNLTANLTAEEREGDRQYGEFKRRLRAIFAPYRLRVPPRLEEVRRDVAGTTGASVLERALTMSLREVRHGATHTVNPSRDDLAATIAAATGGQGVNVAIEATGNAAVTNDALHSVARMGRVVLLGSPRGKLEIDIYHDIHGRGVSLIGAHANTMPTVPNAFHPWTLMENRRLALELMRQGRLQTDGLISHHVSASEALPVWDALTTHQQDYLGVIITWD